MGFLLWILYGLASGACASLAVYYKVEKKVFSPTIRGRIASKIFSGPHEYIPIDGVKMKAQQLCDLLNEKVAESLKN